MPQVSTIQKIADYFKIGKSDLVDEKLEDDPILDARIVSDKKTIDMIKMFYSLFLSDREANKPKEFVLLYVLKCILF